MAVAERVKNTSLQFEVAALGDTTEAEASVRLVRKPSRKTFGFIS